MEMTKGLGYRRDDHDPRDWKARARFGAVRGLPKGVDLRQWVRMVLDQEQSSSCVGHALCQAIDIRLRMIGVVSAPPARLGLYTLAREEEGADLADDGCQPRDAMKAIKNIGVPLEPDWPFDLGKVNTRLPWDVLQAASKLLVFQWWAIDSSGQSRSDAIAQALSNGFPVIFGMEIDNAFFGYSGGTIMGLNADDAGGHMLCIVGYRTRTDATREFLVLNSWGDWGESGYCWIHETVIGGDRVSGIYVVEVSGS